MKTTNPHLTEFFWLTTSGHPDALRLLLKREGYETRVASRPSSGRHRIPEFDAVLMDLNYARDTTSGRRLDLLTRNKCSTARCLLLS